jgi:hypothetical protein
LQQTLQRWQDGASLDEAAELVVEDTFPSALRSRNRHGIGSIVLPRPARGQMAAPDVAAASGEKQRQCVGSGSPHLPSAASSTRSNHHRRWVYPQERRPHRLL